MNPPTVNAIPNVAPGVDQLGTYVMAPGFGYLAVNAYLVRCQQPVLLDAGIGTLQESNVCVDLIADGPSKVGAETIVFMPCSWT
jgi:hypothetical protein